MGKPSLKDRVAGAILGAAIGDAMGHPTEFKRAEEIRRLYPPDGVRGFALWWERDGRRFAPYTDDTQMAEIVLRALIRGRKASANIDAVMDDMAAGFVEWLNAPQGGHRAPGNACMAGAAQLAAGVPWRLAGGGTAGGCGSVMRAYPFGIVLADRISLAQEWAAEHSKMTHRDPIALAACAAMASGVAKTLANEPIELVLEAMVQAASSYDSATALMMGAAIEDARAGRDPSSVLIRLQGWAAHEAIAAAAFVFARHHDEPKEAILEGANADGDSDSIATLAGALVGARRGLQALPQDWVRDVERSEEFLALAEESFELLANAGLE